MQSVAAYVNAHLQHHCGKEVGKEKYFKGKKKSVGRERGTKSISDREENEVRDLHTDREDIAMGRRGSDRPATKIAWNNGLKE